MLNVQFEKDAVEEYQIGDCVVVTGPVVHTGEYGVIVGFFRREQGTTYALVFENGWADLPGINLRRTGKEFCAVLKSSVSGLK